MSKWDYISTFGLFIIIGFGIYLIFSESKYTESWECIEYEWNYTDEVLCYTGNESGGLGARKEPNRNLSPENVCIGIKKSIAGVTSKKGDLFLDAAETLYTYDFNPNFQKNVCVKEQLVRVLK